MQGERTPETDIPTAAKARELGAEAGGVQLTRRRFAFFGAAAAASLVAPACSDDEATPPECAPCSTVTEAPTAERPDPQENSDIFSAPETELAFRCHGMQAELLRLPVTPLGTHFLLIHFDIPVLSATDYSIAIGGRVATPRRVPLSQLKQRQVVTQAVTLECAGTGRSTLTPRAVYVPWFKEAIGNYEWTGTPLRPLLEEAGLLDDAVEVLFTGWDTGIDLGVEHAFERSLPIAEALRDEVMLAWQANGQDLLPQHGFPLRLVVPSYYGMASVKWLRAITVLNAPFQGVEQAKVYRYQQVKGESGEPVTKKRVHSVIAPPGIPDLITRRRFVAPGRHVIQGTAWSGVGRVTRVEVSTDGATTWKDAQLVPVSDSPFGWTQWRTEWEVSAPGEYVLACRATDDTGDVQPVDPQVRWNRQGMGVNGVQRIPVTVQAEIGLAGTRVPSPTRVAVPGAENPPAPTVQNPLA